MILHDGALVRRLHYCDYDDHGDDPIMIHPKPDDVQIQPASIDLRLGDNIITDPLTNEREPIGDELRIEPGEFLLAEVKERVAVPPDLVGFMTGRSTVGRMGVAVHVTAGLVDPGYSGRLTMEVKNHNDTDAVLEPGDRVCQVYFVRLTGEATPYEGQYDGDGTVRGPGEL